MLAVPDRHKETVGEAEGEQVLHRLLAKEVIDAEDLRLIEDPVHGRVEVARAMSAGDVAVDCFRHNVHAGLTSPWFTAARHAAPELESAADDDRYRPAPLLHEAQVTQLGIKASIMLCFDA